MNTQDFGSMNIDLSDLFKAEVEAVQLLHMA